MGREDITADVSWAEAKVALDYHLGKRVRVVVAAIFGFLHSEGVLEADEDAAPNDAAFYKLTNDGMKPFFFSVNGPPQRGCAVTDSAVMFSYDTAEVRVVFDQPLE
jgi:hypothetical protein